MKRKLLANLNWSDSSGLPKVFISIWDCSDFIVDDRVRCLDCWPTAKESLRSYKVIWWWVPEPSPDTPMAPIPLATRSCPLELKLKMYMQLPFERNENGKKALTWWRADVPPSGASHANKIDDISFPKAGLGRSQRGVVGQHNVTASQWLRVK
jgi:hypothetical protein